MRCSGIHLTGLSEIMHQTSIPKTFLEIEVFQISTTTPAVKEWTIIQHWFRRWLGIEQRSSHYLNQWWPSLLLIHTYINIMWPQRVNSSRPEPSGRHFADDIFKYILLNEKLSILSKISLIFLPEDPHPRQESVLFQVMAWHQIGIKPLFKPMMTQTHVAICHH